MIVNVSLWFIMSAYCKGQCLKGQYSKSLFRFIQEIKSCVWKQLCGGGWVRLWFNCQQHASLLCSCKSVSTYRCRAQYTFAGRAGHGRPIEKCDWQLMCGFQVTVIDGLQGTDRPRSANGVNGQKWVNLYGEQEKSLDTRLSQWHAQRESLIRRIELRESKRQFVFPSPQ